MRQRTTLLLLATVVVGLLLTGPANHADAQEVTAPELTSASVQGTMLYADYDQALDESHTPPLSAYVVRINGRRTTVQNVSVSGQRVTLTLQGATIGGDTVLLTYRHRAKPTLRSVSGGLATTVRNVAVEVLSPEAVVETLEPETAESHEGGGGGTPHEPRSVSIARNDKNNEAVVSWQGPSGTTTVSQWQIQCDTSENFDSGFAALNSPGASGDLAFSADNADKRYSYTCTGLITNRRYYGRVRALNGGSNEGPWATTGSSRIALRDVVSITANSSSITEGEDAVFTVKLHSAPDSNTTVTYNVTVSGDYGVSAASDQTVTVGTDGTGTITLSTTDDSNDERDGSITVRVHPAPAGYAKGNPNQVSVTIRDNDEASATPETPPVPAATVAAGTSPITEGASAVFTVTLNPAPSSNVAVNYGITVSGDYGVSAATNQTVTVGTTGTGTITLATTDDSVDEANGSVTVTLETGSGYEPGTTNSASVTVNDNDDPTATLAAGTSPITEGANAVFTVTLSRAQSANVTVNYNVTVSGNFGVTAATNQTVAISSGATTGTITLATTDDSVDEANGSVTVTLATGTGYAVGTANSASVTVNDNDDPTATIAAGPSPITEGRVVVFVVDLDPPPSSNVTVNYNVAVSGDYGVSAANNRTVTVGTAGSAAITVGTTDDDSVDEDSGSVTVTLATGTGYSLGTTTSASVTVNDDDPAGLPIVSIAPGAFPITEGDDAQFTILASGPPSVNLDVPLAVSGGAAFGVTAETRTVTLRAGASVATLTVGTTDDTVAERADDVTVTVTAPAGAGYTPSSTHGGAAVRVNDDDDGFNAPANVRAIGGMGRYTSGEGAPQAQVHVTWDAPPNPPQVTDTNGNSVSAITGYELQEGAYNNDFTSYVTTKELGPNRRSYTGVRDTDLHEIMPDNNKHPNLSLRQTNYFRIRALTGTGDDVVRGPWSPILAARPSEFISPEFSDANIHADEISAPDAPGPVIAVASDASLSVYWGIPAYTRLDSMDNLIIGHAIVAYDLRYRAGDSGTWTTVEDVWTEGSGILKYDIPSPINFQAYQVQVRAHEVVSHNDCEALKVFPDGSSGIPATRCALTLAAWSDIVTATPSDYDADDDGLIEVRTLAQLNAMRYDLDGDGVVTDDPSTSGTDEFTEYTNAFHYPALGQGCPADGCNGYELVANLDFDENGDGTRNDAYNTGAGWQPIGIFSDDGDATNDAAFTAVFEGNGNTVSNLFISRSGADYVGLFGHASFADIRNLGLENVDVTGGNNVGGLAGWNEVGAISDSYVTGSVSGVSNVGGLAGRNNGSITTSYSAAAVSGTGSNAGGLVGRNGDLGSILASYSTGAVSGVNSVGGFAGSNWGFEASIEASFSTGAVSGTGSEVGGFTGSGRDTDDDGDSVRGSFVDSYYDIDFSGVTKGVGDWLDVAGVDGIRTDRLRRPTAYGTGTDIYANWNVDLDGDSTNDDPWDFGASHNYPTLRNTDGHQKGPGRVGNLAAALNGNDLVVSWTAPTEAGAGTLTGNYAGRYSIDGGSTWTAFSTTGATTYTITNLQANTSYDIEVWAIGQGTAHTRGAPASFKYTPVPITDYDSDGDGLLEISNLAQLNAIRWDLDGDGMVDNSANDISYTAAFPNPEAGMGCPDIGCTGYELMESLDFDTNGTTGDRTDDTYYNGGAGWLPIAGARNIGANEGFQAIFEGNDHTISNLFINRYRDYAGECAQHADTPTEHSACLERIEWAGYRIGLFGAVGDRAVIRNLILTNVDVTGDEEVGGLVGISLGEIDMVDVTGDVSGATIDVGGLVGFLLRGRLINSAFDGTVSGTASHMGGLVGANTGATIRYSEAAGTVAPSGSSSGHVGGLAGSNTGTIAASYSTSTVNANDAYWVGGLVGTNGGMYAKGSGRIIACYADNDVHGKGDVGGLVGENYASISTSYSTGEVVKHGGQYAGPVGGLVGRNELNNNDSTVYYSVTDSYWDSDLTTQTFGVGSDSGESNTVPGSTTTQLQTPTGYTGIYQNWDDVDVDGDNTPDDPWNFGTHNDYPVLEYPELP